MSRKKLARRQFLRQLGCTGMGMATFLSSYNNLSLMNKLIGTASAPPNDYKALVCILLAGGNDSYNMLIPRGNGGEWQQYKDTCLLYTSPSPRDRTRSRMPSSA